MSHHLSKIRIKNFRSIVDLELHLSPFTALVGENNVGKSNILNAIQWFVKPEKLEEKHFNNLKNPIVVEGEISGVSEEILQNLTDVHADRLRPFIVEGNITIRRTMDEPAAASRAKLEIFHPGDDDFRTGPTGFPATLSALFPDPVRVEAMVDAPEDVAKNKTTSTLGKLLAMLSEPVEQAQGSRLGQIFSEVNNLFSAEGENRAAELQEFDREASEAVQDFFPGLDISIDFPTPTLPDLFKNGTVVVREDGSPVRRKFEELGHGAQRSIQMALVQMLASRAREDSESPRCTLLLIDEPELYLHPQAIEQVRMSLKKLSAAGYQVLFSTHSPLLIDSADLPDACIISKSNVAEGTKANIRVKESVRRVLNDDHPKQARVLFALGNAKEILFSRRVLLVEGDTEPKVLPSLYAAVRGVSLISDKTGIVQLSGSGDTKRALDVLVTMGVCARALVDLDYAFRQAVRSDFVDSEHPSRQVAIRWFLAKANEHGFHLDDEGFPTKRSDGGSEGAFRKLAEDPANQLAIQQLHDELKRAGIWVWRKGSIEQVVGIDLKNDPASMVSKCLDLQTNGSRELAEEAECREFCEWLSAQN